MARQKQKDIEDFLIDSDNDFYDINNHISRSFSKWIKKETQLKFKRILKHIRKKNREEDLD